MNKKKSTNQCDSKIQTRIVNLGVFYVAAVSRIEYMNGKLVSAFTTYLLVHPLMREYARSGTVHTVRTWAVNNGESIGIFRAQFTFVMIAPTLTFAHCVPLLGKPRRSRRSFSGQSCFTAIIRFYILLSYFRAQWNTKPSLSFCYTCTSAIIIMLDSFL